MDYRNTSRSLPYIMSRIRIYRDTLAGISRKRRDQSRLHFAAEVNRPAYFVSRARSKRSCGVPVTRKIYPRESPGGARRRPPTKIRVTKTEIRGSAGYCALRALKTTGRSFVTPSPPAVCIDSIKTVQISAPRRTPLSSSLQIFVAASAREEARRGVYPGARYSERWPGHTFRVGLPPTDVSKTPLLSVRDLCTHPADYPWRAAKTLDGRFAGFADPLRRARRFGIRCTCLCSKFLDYG